MHQPNTQHLIWNDIQDGITRARTHELFLLGVTQTPALLFIFLSSLHETGPPASTVTPTLTKPNQTNQPALTRTWKL